MKRSRVLAVAALAALSAAAHAQQPTAPAPILSQSFDKGTAGWTAVGASARLDTTSDAKRVRTPGKPCLQFDYEVNQQSLNVLMLPVAAGAWAKAGSVSFALRADTDTAVLLTIQEEGGGRWSAVVVAKKDAWQNVVLGVGDFILSHDNDAPADANGKLDLDRIQAVSVLDVATFFIRIESADFKALVPVSAGPRQLLLADFQVGATPPSGGAAFRIDGLNRPQIGWMALGGPGIARAAAKNPTDGPALEARYTNQPKKLVAFVRAVPSTILATATALNLTLAAEQATTLMVQFEDDAGGKFSARVELEGGKVSKKVTLPLADFQPEGDSKTQTLDRKRVKQIFLGDIRGFLVDTPQPQTLWIGAIEAK